MLYHLVHFKFVETFDRAITPEKFREDVNKLLAIPGVLGVEFGKIEKNLYNGFMDRSDGFTHSLLVLLTDQDALEVYDKSDIHTEMKQKCILPYLDKTAQKPVLAIDYYGQFDNIESKFMEGLHHKDKKSSSLALGIIISSLVLAGALFFRKGY